jgi:hypothetical protein
MNYTYLKPALITYRLGKRRKRAQRVDVGLIGLLVVALRAEV